MDGAAIAVREERERVERIGKEIAGHGNVTAHVACEEDVASIERELRSRDGRRAFEPREKLDEASAQHRVAEIDRRPAVGPGQDLAAEALRSAIGGCVQRTEVKLPRLAARPGFREQEDGASR